MEIQRKTKGKPKVSLNTSEFPHDIHFYVNPPTHEIALADLYELAFHRLRILRLIEEVTLRVRTKYTEDWRSSIINEIRKLGLKKLATLYSSSGSSSTPIDESARRDDNVSHYLLRLAYSNSVKNQPWFINREIDLFRLRFGYLSQEGLHNFVEFNKFEYVAISNEEKMQVTNQLIQCTSGCSSYEVESNEFYKVPFQNVPDLVRHRKVFLSGGYAYVPASELVYFFAQLYRGVLNKGLQALARITPLLDGDTRLAPLFNGIHDVYMGRDYSQNTEDQTSILPQEIDQLAMESFPPCMQRLHSQLRSTHHLHHFGRLRYTLFLKGAGLSFENSLAFFKDEYLKLNPEKYEKEYSYTIKHSYGKVGQCKDYTPYSCTKLILDPLNEGSCPFKYDSRQALHKWLSSLGSNFQGGDVQNILQSVDNEQFGHACTKYFELIHGEGPESIINHPNQFVEESRRLRSGKEKQETGKSRIGKSVPVPVKETNGTKEMEVNPIEGLEINAEDFEEWDEG